MATVLSNFPAALLVHRAQYLSGGATSIAPLLNVSSSGGRKNSIAIVVKATSDSSESSTSLDIVKSVQNVWENSEDRVAIIGLGFAAVIGVWASANVVLAIDKLPIVPSFFELIGILYSSWFIYRYLLFKPDREELFQSINKSISSILGQ